MGDVAIRVEGLSKQYRIGVREGINGTLRDAFSGWMKILSRGHSSHSNDGEDIIWALKDVSFEVKQGEVLGVIGRNGSGKSTLLKILSRITEPTAGGAEIHGRVASLLEVGTGFHPELTGRENIYMNGAILGMKKAEIARKFDEIVAFSEVEKFIDTAVKHYSSGMYVRLAFAVAAHLDPEVLIVDEVLAVGDAGFQKKCLGKMREVSEQGRTVLFVSHNMTAVSTLTQRCIALDRGAITRAGKSEEVIRFYLTQFVGEIGESGCFDLTKAERNPKHNPKTAKAYFVKGLCLDEAGQSRSRFVEGEPMTFQVQFQVTTRIDAVEVHCYINTILDMRVCSMLSNVMEMSLVPGTYNVNVTLKPNYLRPGDYFVSLGLYTPSEQDGIKQALQFRVEPSPEAQNNVNWAYHNLGVVRLPYNWSTPTAIEKKVSYCSGSVVS